MSFLISNPIIIHYLTIFDVSNLDIACTNKKIREYVLSLFANAIIYVDFSKKHLFYNKCFLDYIKIRNLYITNWYILNNLNYFLDSPKCTSVLCHYVNTLKVIEYNISMTQLLSILNNFHNLSILTLGNLKTEEAAAATSTNAAAATSTNAATATSTNAAAATSTNAAATATNAPANTSTDFALAEDEIFYDIYPF
jgi:hypothetical protein